jgi:hypothetical protein
MKDGIPEGLYGGDKIDDVRERAIFNTEIHDVGLRGAVWCKLFRRDKLSEALRNVSDRLTYSEDKIIVMYYLLECSSVYIIHETYYHYLINANSMVNAENTNYLESINEVYRAFIGMYPHAKFTRGMRLQAEMYVTEQLIKGINTRMGFENQNMMRIDPYWIEKIPMGTRVALCGAGEFGKIYRRILHTRQDIRYSGCLDEHPELFENDNALGEILPLSSAALLEFDYIVITIKNPEKAGKVKIELEKYVSEKRILWFKQEEIYWRFAQANGLI